MTEHRSDRSALNKQARVIAEELQRALPNLVIEIALKSGPTDKAALDRAIQEVDAARVLQILAHGLRGLPPLGSVVACGPAADRKRTASPTMKETAGRRVRGSLSR